jgi:hypothetical protein
MSQQVEEDCCSLFPRYLARTTKMKETNQGEKERKKEKERTNQPTQMGTL